MVPNLWVLSCNQNQIKALCIFHLAYNEPDINLGGLSWVIPYNLNCQAIMLETLCCSPLILCDHPEMTNTFIGAPFKLNILVFEVCLREKICTHCSFWLLIDITESVIKYWFSNSKFSRFIPFKKLKNDFKMKVICKVCKGGMIKFKSFQEQNAKTIMK